MPTFDSFDNATAHASTDKNPTGFFDELHSKGIVAAVDDHAKEVGVVALGVAAVAVGAYVNRAEILALACKGAGGAEAGWVATGLEGTGSKGLTAAVSAEAPTGAIEQLANTHFDPASILKASEAISSSSELPITAEQPMVTPNPDVLKLPQWKRGSSFPDMGYRSFGHDIAFHREYLPSEIRGTERAASIGFGKAPPVPGATTIDSLAEKKQSDFYNSFLERHYRPVPSSEMATDIRTGGGSSPSIMKLANQQPGVLERTSSTVSTYFGGETDLLKRTQMLMDSAYREMGHSDGTVAEATLPSSVIARTDSTVSTHFGGETDLLKRAQMLMKSAFRENFHSDGTVAEATLPSSVIERTDSTVSTHFGGETDLSKRAQMLMKSAYGENFHSNGPVAEATLPSSVISPQAPEASTINAMKGNDLSDFDKSLERDYRKYAPSQSPPLSNEGTITERLDKLMKAVVAENLPPGISRETITTERLPELIKAVYTEALRAGTH
jgi:hypothetical protein